MTKIRHFIGSILLCAIFLCVSLPANAAIRVQEAEDPIVVVIDPGHGGENLGTIENGFLEKEMTLITATAMYEELCLYDNVEVYLTRTEDVDLTLKARAEYAASVNADFLFSIHYNASVKHDLFGSEIWISATPPYNAYGYQFGYEFQEQMRDMGLFLRGIKTRLNDEKTDYYGIIREATALSVPAVILEHCHVDQYRDNSYCDTDEELIAFGKADALAVAKYFGLKSTALGVDYSTESTLPEANKDYTVKSTLLDDTPPDVCMIEMAETERVNDNANLILTVSAADYDSPLIYFDFSVDGGITYSPLEPWPKSDVLEGTYQDTFELSLQIPYADNPEIVLRAYNLFDAYTESNRLSLPLSFWNNVNAEVVNNADSSAESVVTKEEKQTPGTTTFMPAISEQIEEGSGEVSFLSFLKLCLIIVIILFFFVLVSQVLVYNKRKRRRRQRKNVEGSNRYHPK